MSYIDDSLARGETILYRAQVHWAVFAPAGVFAALFFFSTIAGFVNSSFFVGSFAFFLSALSPRWTGQSNS